MLKLNVDEALEFDEETSRRLREWDSGNLVSDAPARPNRAPNSAVPSGVRSAPARPRRARAETAPLRNPRARVPVSDLESRHFLSGTARFLRRILRFAWRWAKRLLLLELLLILFLIIPVPKDLPASVAQSWLKARSWTLRVPGVAFVREQGSRGWEVSKRKVETLSNGLRRKGYRRTEGVNGAASARSATSHWLDSKAAEAIRKCLGRAIQPDQASWWVADVLPVNLRRGAGRRFGVREIVWPGEVTRVTGAIKEGWLPIRLASGHSGYVYPPLGRLLKRLPCGRVRLKSGRSICRRQSGRCQAMLRADRDQEYMRLDLVARGERIPLMLGPRSVGYLPGR